MNFIYAKRPDMFPKVTCYGSFKLFVRCPYCKQKINVNKMPSHKVRCNPPYIRKILFENGITPEEAFKISEQCKKVLINERIKFNRERKINDKKVQIRKQAKHERK